MRLAGDVGGSKTALGSLTPLAHASYPSGDGESLIALVHRFLAPTHLPVHVVLTRSAILSDFGFTASGPPALFVT